MNGEEAFDLFRTGWREQRMAQAYVLAGSLKGAVVPVADRVLAMLFCEKEDAPCGHCLACRQAAEHVHPDLAWMEPEKKSRAISVDQMRAMQQRMTQTSFAGGWKAAALYAADRLNVNAANAFLKLLEEPPAQTLFLLLTDSPQFLLPTIVSRCQRLAIAGHSDMLQADWRERALDIMERAGSVGPITAMALAEQTQRLLSEIKAAAAVEIKSEAQETEMDEEKATLDARTDARYKGMRKEVVLLALAWFRDVLMATVGMEDDVFEHRERAAAIRRKAARLTTSAARDNLTAIENMNRMLERNVTENMALTIAFGALR